MVAVLVPEDTDHDDLPGLDAIDDLEMIPEGDNPPKIAVSCCLTGTWENPQTINCAFDIGNYARSAFRRHPFVPLDDAIKVGN